MFHETYYVIHSSCGDEENIKDYEDHHEKVSSLPFFARIFIYLFIILFVGGQVRPFNKELSNYF